MEKLAKLLEDTPIVDIGENDKILIISDLHMGNGRKMDDFRHNGGFVRYVLEYFYEKENYHLVLNGDIEELHRFTLKEITAHWKDLYQVFKRFQQRRKLYKLIGNHDYELALKKKLPSKIPVMESLKLRYNHNDVFIFHGHQASPYFNVVVHWLISIILRFFANLLRIKNFSVAHNHRKKYKIEKRVYDFARKNKIMAIIGHTHRPLFESLSKKETLKFKIENLCREYPLANPEKKSLLERRIKKYQKELMEIIKKREDEDLISTLYNSSSEPLVPCMFNSGCAIGKSGFTTIEIDRGHIRLVYWFDTMVSKKYLDFNGYHIEPLKDTPYFRAVLKEDNLNYLFTRIKLLSD
jgi:UDP-2,3-diacylglucosamine pyrophosphatase LpxH